jgi:hypothetical protein
VQSSGRSSTGELLTNFCCIFTIIGIVTFKICFSLQEKYKEEVVKNMAKTSTMRRNALTAGPSMTAEAEKHMDGEINALFSLSLWMQHMVPLTTADCFFWRFALFDGVLDSREAMPPRQSSSSTSSSLMPRVSQVHLNYESMQSELRLTQVVLAKEQEDHREAWDSVNAFNAQIQVFMVVRNNNTFITFLTFSDIYVCFTLFILQAMV